MALTTEKATRKNWYSALAQAIENLDSPSFESRLVEAVKDAAGADSAILFIYRIGSKPEAAVADCPPQYRNHLIEDYANGPFMLDPFYIASCSGMAPGLYSLRELAPNRFRQSEYYRSYYVTSGIAEESCFILPAVDEWRGVISLSRMQPRRGFSDLEKERLLDIAPVINALAQRAWQRHPKHATSPVAQPVPKNFEARFLDFKGDVLSRREREVAAMILRGYSSAAIGVELGIAEATVKANRRSIYAKLGISSQAELFALFIREMR